MAVGAGDLGDGLEAEDAAATEFAGSRERVLEAVDGAQGVELVAPAVPALLSMLASEDEGLRNSACLGLRGIGAAARDALPALGHAYPLKRSAPAFQSEFAEVLELEQVASRWGYAELL